MGIFLEMRSLTTNNLSRQSKTLGKMADSDGNYVRFKLKDSWPIELSDLTGALSAFGGALHSTAGKRPPAPTSRPVGLVKNARQDVLASEPSESGGCAS